MGSKPLKFLLVGIWNTAIGYVAFIVLNLIFSAHGTHYMIALTLSQIIIIGNAYLSYKFFVFRTEGISWGEPSRFILIYALNFVVNLILLPIFVNVAKMTPVLGQGVVVLILSAANYLGHNYFTFRQPPSSERVGT